MSLCHSVSKKHSTIICLYVILSLKKNSVFTRPYVILSLKKHSAIICLYVILSLKKHSVFTRPYVILSPKYPD